MDFNFSTVLYQTYLLKINFYSFYYELFCYNHAVNNISILSLENFKYINVFDIFYAIINIEAIANCLYALFL